MPGTKADHVPTRQTLLSRLRDWEDNDSWQQFFDTYWKLIYGLAIKSGLSESDAQDVVQATVVAVAKAIPDFKYNPELGSFKSWLFLITRRRISDHLRKKRREPLQTNPTSDTGTAPLEQLPDPASLDLNAVWDAEWEKQIMITALKQVRQEVDPRQFQIFDCYVLKEWPVKDLVKHFTITPGQVYLAKHRISALLKKALARIEKNN